MKAGTTDLGDVLVGPEGLTLYGFTNDSEAASTCQGTCAEQWPPVLVDEDWTVGPELDAGIFATTVRDDGQLQLVAGRWPLYYYAGDAVPGDIEGQGSGGVWFVVAADGTLIKDETGDSPPAGGATVATAQTALGEVLVDADGRTLYAFTKDADGTPTCSGDCAGTWPPALVQGSAVVGPGLNPSVFTTVASPNGGQQLKAGKWPLYTFSGDSAPGDVNGQGSGGVWFVVKSDGSLQKGSDSGAASGTDYP